MKVHEIMTREISVCYPGEALSDIAQILWDDDLGCLPVLDEKEMVVGMITDRDICMAAFTQGRRLNDIEVSTAMSQNLFACKPDDSLVAANKIMKENKVKRLPVINQRSQLVGMITLNDLAQEACRKDGNKKPGIRRCLVSDCLAQITQPTEKSRLELA